MKYGVFLAPQTMKKNADESGVKQVARGKQKYGNNELEANSDKYHTKSQYQ